MDCKTIKKYLPFYYYNDLNKITISEVKSHIKNCSYCRKEFNCLKKTIRLVGKEEKKKLPFAYRRALLNKILEASNLKEERGVLQRKRVFALSSGFAITLLICFSLLLSIRTVDMNLNWQNDPFTYGVEELNKQIVETNTITSTDTLQLSSYTLDEKIDNIYEEIEELIVFLNYNPQ